jgi:superfamily II DNA/RNA helicase
MNFGELNIQPELVSALEHNGITEPTDIQAQAIPLVLKGKDIIGMSKTGSGKTIAFGLPLLQMVQPHAGLQVLIIVPTRELCVQIADEMTRYGKSRKLSVATAFGGVGFEPQITGFKHSEILVATPGRLLDHLGRNSLKLSTIKTVVLDEADKMAEMGFVEDVERILAETPQGRQVLLFGATISDDVQRLKSRYMNEPEIVKSQINVEEDILEQYYIDIKPHEKFSLLMHLLKTEHTDRVIIFCSKRQTVEIVAHNLERSGIRSELLHGKLTQNRRLRVLERFRHGEIKVLVASAVAARGLDIRDVSHIVNYDVPMNPEEYVHRVGRTARAGEKGKAITLLCDRDHDAFSSVLRNFPVNVHKLEKPSFPRMHFDARSSERSFDDGPRRGGFRRDSVRSGGRSFGRSSNGGSPRGPMRREEHQTPRFEW